jgi:hypothetical protein
MVVAPLKKNADLKFDFDQDATGEFCIAITYFADNSEMSMKISTNGEVKHAQVLKVYLIHTKNKKQSN